MILRNYVSRFRRCYTVITLATTLVAACRCAGAEEMKRFAVDPDNAIIVVPAKADRDTLTAAAELGKHVALITGVELKRVEESKRPEGKYAFYVGISPLADGAPLKPEEARWVITPQGTWCYGQPLFAVYGFLEGALGIRWLEPGDQGIAYEQQTLLRLSPGQFGWAPILKQRGIRAGISAGRPPVLPANMVDFKAWLPTKEQHEQTARDRGQWCKRMRMGRHADLGYGHSFTDWWDKYGKAHPEYFALNKYGKREPESQKANPQNPTEAVGLGQKSTVKLCNSNPKVAEQVVQDWLANGRRSKWVGVCENDMGWGFCSCPKCRDLDGEKAATGLGDYETYDDFLTDRCVYLTNAVARGARKHDPDAGAVMYAYNQTELPPTRQEVEPNVMVGLVPTTINLSKLQRLYDGWQAAGARTLFLRPNYGSYYATTVIPMGFEKQMFDAFQLGVEHGVIAADYDSLTGHWPVTGISDYILAKAFSDPSRSFEYWEDHYCAGYGPAADAVKRYFRYWRQEVWDKRLLPELDAIVERGRYYNLVRGVMWSLDTYYTEQDFGATDAILQEASAKTLSASQRAHLGQLILANQHARLTFRAITAKGKAKFGPSLALLAFRRLHRDDLRLPWLGTFSREIYWGDITGIKTAIALQDYPQPWLLTDLFWRFRLDPQDVGLTEKWPEKAWAEVKKWDQIRSDHVWESLPKKSPHPSPALRAQLRNYDGIGWYATRLTIPAAMKGRPLFLYFGAVDESCWVYVNGKLAGRHLYENEDDWRTPFEIRIDPLLDWEKSRQLVMVRVEDNAGAGGIWRRVWVVSKDHARPDPQ